MNLEKLREELKDYLKHPRILEIRIIIIFNVLERDFGFDKAVKFISSICNSFYLDSNKIMNIIYKRNDIKRSIKVNKLRWKQEVVFYAFLKGMTKYKLAKDILITSKSNLYKPEFHLDKFVTNEWLTGLDGSVVYCGVEIYKLEAIKFLEIIDELDNVLMKLRN